MRDICRQYT